MFAIPQKISGALLAALLLGPLACGTMSAYNTDNFTQSECVSGDTKPLTIQQVPQDRDAVTLSAQGDRIAIDYQYAHFRCAQKVHFVAAKEGQTITITAQPVDLNPSAVAGCDCEYHLKGAVGPFPAGTYTVKVIRRWDNKSGENATKEIHSSSLTLSGA